VRALCAIRLGSDRDLGGGWWFPTHVVALSSASRGDLTTFWKGLGLGLLLRLRAVRDS
jgi:hypothetical protein